MKKVIKLVTIIFITTIIVGCGNTTTKKDVKKNNNNDVTTKESVDNMKVLINDKEYIVKLEDNDTVKKLITLLPIEVEMKELNGNEKYIYLDHDLPTNSISPKHINKGDVYLYGDNCLVIFYKDFDTTYTYTKIGHIDNLEDLNNSNIKVKFFIDNK